MTESDLLCVLTATLSANCCEKTRMQSQYSSKILTGMPILRAIRESPTSLWRGVTSLILGAGPSHALYFGTYELSKSTLLEHTNVAPTVVYGASGVLFELVLLVPSCLTYYTRKRNCSHIGRLRDYRE